MEIDYGKIQPYTIILDSGHDYYIITVPVEVMIWLNKYHVESFGWHFYDGTNMLFQISVRQDILTLLRLKYSA